MTETVLGELAPDITGVMEFAGFSKKPFYVLNDSVLIFWFKYVNRAVSIINAGKGERYYHESVACHLHDFMGSVYEKICKEYLIIKSCEDGYPMVTELDNFQKTILDDGGKLRQIEIDILGKYENEVRIIGECKLGNEKVDKESFDNFLDKAHYIKSNKPFLCMFSLNGYTEYVKENAGGVTLLTIDDLYL